MRILLCDICGGQLGGSKLTFFDIEEIPYYAIRRGSTKVKYDVCFKCEKKLAKLIHKLKKEAGK